MNTINYIFDKTNNYENKSDQINTFKKRSSEQGHKIERIMNFKLGPGVKEISLK